MTDFLSSKQIKYLKEHRLFLKFEKQYNLLINNPRHPSLNIELLEPKDLGLYSFRLDQKYRVIFILNPDINNIEIISVTNHYH